MRKHRPVVALLLAIVVAFAAPSNVAAHCASTSTDYVYYDGCTSPVIIASSGVGCDFSSYSYGNPAGAEWRTIETYQCESVHPCREIDDSYQISYEKWCNGVWVSSSASEFGNGCNC